MKATKWFLTMDISSNAKPAKVFVNAPLNPQRNAQQFKEDGLRRRALEVLVNTLLDRNLVHFEFEENKERVFKIYLGEV